MLVLLFRLGVDRYAIDTAQVIEVLPLVALKKIPRAPAGVAGAFNYHGVPVPVVDLSELALGRPASERLSTRIVLVRHTCDGARPRLLGLIAESAIETLRCAPEEFTSAGVSSPDARYLGPVRPDAHGLIQWIEVDALLRPAVREALFRTVEETAS